MFLWMSTSLYTLADAFSGLSETIPALSIKGVALTPMCCACQNSRFLKSSNKAEGTTTYKTEAAIQRGIFGCSKNNAKVVQKNITADHNTTMDMARLYIGSRASIIPITQFLE
eukprot:Tbor_TRINITY_DN5528_c2_g4::TRINITY_DN5528_c2_g4_i1::g.13109::m.13109